MLTRYGRLVATHIGLAAILAGFFLPWATVGGRKRTGAGLANLSLSLPDLGFRTPLQFVGYSWYALPITALALWLSLFRNHPPRPDRTSGALAVILVVVSAMFWVLLQRGPLQGPHSGAMVVLAGSVTTGLSCWLPLRSPQPSSGASDVL